MKANQAKRRVSEGKTVFGSFVFSRDPSHVEVLGAAGYDFAIIDMEHAAMGAGDVERLVRAAEASSITPLVRIPTADEPLIGRVLDTGAQGILLPHLTNRAEARRVAQAAHYPPRGVRGACTGVRATEYSSVPFATHVKETATEVWVLGLIEDASAADAIEDILAGGDMDGVMPGPGDLSTSLGVPGELTHPEVTKRVDRVIEAAVNRSLMAGMYVGDPADAGQWIARGARFIVYSLDSKVLYEAYRRGLDRMRAAMPAAGG
jgi:4-hydroxy-2-oxoheptanedioate aldolase